MRSIVAIVGVVLALAWLIDYVQLRRERRAKKQRQWWSEPGDPPEGDY